MSGKSSAQRVVEVIALVAVAGCLVPIAIAVWGHFYKPTPKPQPEAVKYTPPAQPAPVQRSAVKSVDELPKSYPATDDVAGMRESLLSTGSRPKLPPGVQVRHLNAFVGGGTLGGFAYLSPNGELAVVLESTPASTTRAAIWNVATGKLVRFFSVDEGRGTEPYRGVENADFGAKVDFDGVNRGTFSPDGKRFVGCLGVADLLPDRTTFMWEVATGKLLWKTVEPASQFALLYPSDDYVVVGSPVGMREFVWQRIDARTGESELLLPATPSGGMGLTQLGSFSGEFVELRDHALTTIKVATRELLTGPSQKEEGAAPVFHRFWYSSDGQQVFGFTREAALHVWDLPAHKRSRKLKLEAEQPQSEVYPAPAANLVGNRNNANAVEFFDVTTGQRKFSFYLPFRNVPLKAITSDAKRWLIQTDQSTLLIFDFTGGLPEGRFTLADFLGTEKVAATR